MLAVLLALQTVVVHNVNVVPMDRAHVLPDHVVVVEKGRIKALASEYHDQVPVLLVNSDATETIESLVKKATAQGFSIPYLADKDQKLMSALGATKSPQAFLLKNTGGKFSVVYNGAIDDNAQVEAGVRHAYLKDAIDIMLANQTIATAEVRPAGCTIRKK